MPERWILFYDGSASHYHAIVVDGNEQNAHEMADLISQLNNVPVYVYKTCSGPAIVTNVHDKKADEKAAS